MIISKEIRERILKANAEDHDIWADTHDSNVPYISRKSTRKYYWNLIESNINSAGNKIKKSEILEIGCGTGTFTNLFIKNGAHYFTGIDLSARMIEKAKAKALELKYDTKSSFFVNSLENFALNNKNKFDIIQSSSFIHHLADIDEGLILIKTMLKPGGVYIAIHEELNDRAKNKIEKLDSQMQHLFGYGGSGVIDFKTRTKDTLRFFLNLIINPIRRSITSINLKQEVSEKENINASNLNENEINYVDFQLNKSFSLSSSCSKHGIVKSYCYLGFTNLMFFDKPLNFEMLIMKK